MEFACTLHETEQTEKGNTYTCTSIFSLCNARYIRVMTTVSITGQGWGPADKASLAVTSFSFDETTSGMPKLELKRVIVKQDVRMRQ